MRPRTQMRAICVEKLVGERGDRLVIIQFPLHLQRQGVLPRCDNHLENCREAITELAWRSRLRVMKRV